MYLVQRVCVGPYLIALEVPAKLERVPELVLVLAPVNLTVADSALELVEPHASYIRHTELLGEVLPEGGVQLLLVDLSE